VHVPKIAIIGATLLAISPGALMVPQRMLGVRCHTETVFGSSVVASLSAIVTVPFWLAVIGWLFVGQAAIAPFAVARLVGILFLLPLGLASIVRRFGPASMGKASGAVIVAADLLLLLSLLPLFSEIVHALPLLGLPFLIAVTVTPTVAVLVTGIVRHSELLERPELALVCSTRHPGLALLVAATNFPGEAVLAAVMVSFVGGMAASLLYAWLTRHLRAGVSVAFVAPLPISLDDEAVPPAATRP
jgi:BASS family bile acid:Na+ symporter